MFGLNESLPRSYACHTSTAHNTSMQERGRACDISVGLVMLTALSVCTIDHFYEPLN